MFRKEILMLSAIASLGTTSVTPAATLDEAIIEAIDQHQFFGAVNLRRWEPSQFHRDIVQAVQALGSAHGSEKDGILLDTAELYLSHMLQYEAESTLLGIKPVRPEHVLHHKALSDASALLGGRPVSDFHTSSLVISDRGDSSFWWTLQAIASGDGKMLRTNFKRSFEGLSKQSPTVLRTVLPIFAEAAIELDEHQHADAALSLMRDLQDFDGSTILQFLTARAEERRDNISSALTAYFEAAEGWDTYAARARLGIADMSLRNGGTGALLAAEAVLKQGQEAWRGDQLELELLRRLAEVYAALGNKPEGLLTLGKLTSRFPNTRAAKSARMDAEVLLAEVYSASGDGSHNLTDWMELHLKLMQFYRHTPSFAQHTESLADHMLSLGATDLAATEYQRAMGLIRKYRTSTSPTKVALNRIALKLAKAQMRGGLVSDAKVTLQKIETMAGTDQHEQLNQTYAEVMAALGDNKALIKNKLAAPAPKHLRSLAEALAEEERWSEARDVLQEYLNIYPQTFSAKDAMRFLIAANRIDDFETRDRIIQMFPSLSGDTEVVELAKSLEGDTEQLLPLRTEEAAARLLKLEDAFQSINNTGIFDE